MCPSSRYLEPGSLPMTRLREPNPADADMLAELMSQLGYPCDPDDVQGRIEQLSNDPNVLLAVAEHEGKVVGVVTGHLVSAIHKSGPVAMLTALVVLESARGLGIGKRLVSHVEHWARDHGASTLSLTSALRRSDAHEFYRRLGYEHTGLRLAKALT
jgi:GNAT superfamily N-acetyltransferase